jgi:hypothetical protein
MHKQYALAEFIYLLIYFIFPYSLDVGAICTGNMH